MSCLNNYKFFGEIAVAALIRIGILFAIVLICFIPLIFKLVSSSGDFDSIMDDPFTAIKSFGIPLVIMLILIFIVYTFWMFGFLFIVFPKFKAWQSLEASRKIISKKFFNWFGFGILLGLVNLAGTIAFGIGLLVTIPASVCAIYLAFDEVCGVHIRP